TPRYPGTARRAFDESLLWERLSLGASVQTVNGYAQDLWPGVWYTHRLPPRLRKGPGASIGETHPQGKGSGPRARGRERSVRRGIPPSGVADERRHPHPVRDRAGRPARGRPTPAAGLRPAAPP